jgi:hypothetical protein
MRITLAIYFAVSLFARAMAQAPDQQVLDFAKSHMALIHDIPESNLPEFGLSKNDIAHLELTQVFAEYTLINEQPVKTNNYRVLVMNAKHIPCGLLTVHEKEGVMEAADFGAYELSRKISENLSNFPSSAHVSILRVYNLKADFLFDDTLPAERMSFLKLYGDVSFSLEHLNKQNK